MFSKAAQIRIPTAVSFYGLTFLLSMMLFSLLRVNPDSFCFGVATTLLAHAAVHLVTSHRIPVWATLYILALVVPLFPPKALIPIERGALYWGILAGLASYTITYGAQYLLRLNAERSGESARNDRRKKPDRHTSEIFHLLGVTNLSQAQRAVRKLLHERDQRHNAAIPAAHGNDESKTAELEEKLKETQHQLKQLKKQHEGGKKPRENQRRQMQNRLEEAQRKLEETIAAREKAEQRVQSMQGLQLKVAELTQQTNALRIESKHEESLVQGLHARISSAESARDKARSECAHVESELTRLSTTVQEVGKARTTVVAAEAGNVQKLDELNHQAQAAQTRNQDLMEKLQRSEETLATTRCEVESLQHLVGRLRARSEEGPDKLEQAQQRIALFEEANKQFAAELQSSRHELSDKNRELEQVNTQIGEMEQTADKFQKQFESVRQRIAELEETVTFHQRTINGITPEIDRLDRIIGRYEAAFGPPPSEK